MKRFLTLLLPLLFVVVLAGVIGRARIVTQPVVVEGYTPWPAEIVDQARTLPIQSGGRTMPLDTFARFALYRLSGRSGITIRSAADGRRLRIGPTAWLLDCLFRPELAAELPVLLVDNPEIFTTLGLDGELGAKRDRFAFRQLEPAFARLEELVQPISMLDAKARDASQNELMALYGRIVEEDKLLNSFAWADRPPVQLISFYQPGLGFPETPMRPLALEPQVIVDALAPGQAPAVAQFGRELDEAFRLLAQRGEHLDLVPPAAASPSPGSEAAAESPASPPSAAWWAAGDLLRELRAGSAIDRARADSQLRDLEGLAHAEPASPAFAEALARWSNRPEIRAALDGNAGRVSSESAFYRAHLLGRAQAGWWLVLALIALASLLGPRPAARRVETAARLAALAPVLLLAAAIAWRCWLRQRPPVTNLYDTFLFVTFAATSVGLVAEWITRRRLPLLLTTLLGILGLVAAARFEIGMGVDTSQPEVAVLDTNYWLTIHVLTIAIGYSAVVLAAAVSMAWLTIRAIEGPKDAQGNLRQLNTLSYAVICFGVLFSTVGTILGGVWANESWGRFWGWDPKENGALMIVLAQLALLHGRLGGMLKPLAFNTCVVFTGIVVLFSWFHVNLLGVGLHAYGFTQAKSLWQGLNTGYAVLSSFVLLGIGISLFDRRGKRSPTGSSPTKRTGMSRPAP